MLGIDRIGDPYAGALGVAAPHRRQSRRFGQVRERLPGHRLEDRPHPARHRSAPVTTLQAGPRPAEASAIQTFQADLLPALLPLFAALASWVACLQRIDPGAMSDLGLASVLLPAAWLPYLLLSAGFFFVLCRQPGRAWL